ncbi:hypothetical protein [Acidovorax lacteus]|uniref:DUF2946 domain-containing protein n=1 Tax=Acidovorax lacteus TaxID=1924988 RepID=A0ABP8L253_9BURK
MHAARLMVRDTPRLHRGVWLLLWLALCMAPWVGRLHQVLHAPGGHTPHGTTVAMPHGHAGEHAHDIWHGHDSNDCRLLDHLALADALCSTALQQPPSSDPGAQVAAHSPGVLLVRLRGFEARAPPTTHRA